MRQDQRISQYGHEAGKVSFVDEFVKIHSLLYEPCRPPEVEPFVVAHLQDRLNMRRYFEKAILDLGLDKASRQ